MAILLNQTAIKSLENDNKKLYQIEFKNQFNHQKIILFDFLSFYSYIWGFGVLGYMRTLCFSRIVRTIIFNTCAMAKSKHWYFLTHLSISHYFIFHVILGGEKTCSESFTSKCYGYSELLKDGFISSNW